MAKIKKSELKLYSTRDFEKRLGKNLHITQKEVKRLLYGYIDTVKELLLMRLWTEYIYKGLKIIL